MRKISIIIFLLILVAGAVFLYSFKFRPTAEETEFVEEEVEIDLELQTKAVSELDASYCEGIRVESFFVSKDACYNSVASKTKDRALCEKIQKEALKDNCYKNTQ